MSVKKHIVDTMKHLYKKKLISARDGNVSFKPKNSNYFYISAGSVKKNEINSDQVIKVKFLNDKISFDRQHKYLPSREIYMHSYIQTFGDNFGKDIFVVHAHPPNIISYMGIFDESRELNDIKKYFPEINVGSIGKNVKYHDAGSINLARDCYSKLVGKDIVGLERHGSLSQGENIEKIYEDIETLEYYIKILLMSKEK
jgi:ribulose-5-phosphate 4-epimerase/fuculose-1-phosphate aldolase